MTASAAPSVRQALRGIQVLEVAEGIAGPFAGKLLAGHGATVIKVERPSGDPSRSYGPFPDDVADAERSGMFAYLNADKMSVSLDLASSPGRDELHRLAGAADVLIVSGRSAAEVETLAGRYQDLAHHSPGRVMTTITPFGMDGPLANQSAYDVNFCALGGITTTIGERDREPLTPPLDLSSFQAGLAASSGSLLALLARRRTGHGQHVDVSPVDAWATVHQGTGLMNALAFGRRFRRSGRRRRDAYPFHLMPAKDGLMCMIARDGNQWKRFVLDVVGDPVLTEPRYRDRLKMGLEYPDEVDRLLAPWFTARTREEIFALCREHHIPFSPVRTLDEVAECDQLRFRGFFANAPAVERTMPVVRMPGAPYLMSATPWRAPGRSPRLGEHTTVVAASAAPWQLAEALR